jgi:hypothetical protein
LYVTESTVVKLKLSVDDGLSYFSKLQLKPIIGEPHVHVDAVATNQFLDILTDIFWLSNANNHHHSVGDNHFISDTVGGVSSIGLQYTIIIFQFS